MLILWPLKAGKKSQENWLEEGSQKIFVTLTKLAVSGKVFLRWAWIKREAGVVAGSSRISETSQCGRWERRSYRNSPVRKASMLKNLKDASRPYKCHYFANRKAWMNSDLTTDISASLNRRLQLKQRKIMLFMDNAPCHPASLQGKFSNINIVILRKKKQHRRHGHLIAA